MRKLINALIASATLFTAAPSFADSFTRRDEVNARLRNENHRIDAGRRDGQLSRGEARRLHRADGRIAREERRDVRRNGGYLTRGESARINRQENRVSGRIYRDRRY